MLLCIAVLQTRKPELARASWHRLMNRITGCEYGTVSRPRSVIAILRIPVQASSMKRPEQQARAKKPRDAASPYNHDCPWLVHVVRSRAGRAARSFPDTSSPRTGYIRLADIFDSFDTTRSEPHDNLAILLTVTRCSEGGSGRSSLRYRR
jgi:hypothetical protein